MPPSPMAPSSEEVVSASSPFSLCRQGLLRGGDIFHLNNNFYFINLGGLIRVYRPDPTIKVLS